LAIALSKKFSMNKVYIERVTTPWVVSMFLVAPIVFVLFIFDTTAVCAEHSYCGNQHGNGEGNGGVILLPNITSCNITISGGKLIKRPVTGGLGALEVRYSWSPNVIADIKIYSPSGAIKSDKDNVSPSEPIYFSPTSPLGTYKIEVRPNSSTPVVCTKTFELVAPKPECSDGKDNDDPEDTKIDMADPGCKTPTDDDETDLPNLSAAMKAPGSMSVGTTVSLTPEIANTSNVTIGTLTRRIVTWRKSTAPIATRVTIHNTVGTYSKNTTWKGNVAFTPPGVGTYEVCVVADSTNVLTEVTESDNQDCSVITVFSPTDTIPPDIDVSLNASPSTSLSGKPITLTWSTTGEPTSCTASANPVHSGWSGSVAPSGGTKTVMMNSLDTRFEITCVKGTRTEKDHEDVKLEEIPTVPIVPAPECSDGKDNSDPEDTKVDMADPGCTGPLDPSEVDTPTAPPVTPTTPNSGTPPGGTPTTGTPTSGTPVVTNPPTYATAATFLIAPGTVRKENRAQMSWNTGGRPDCTITATNGDNRSGFTQVGSSPTAPIMAETTYTFSCPGDSTLIQRIIKIFSDIVEI
jgi:hypothetical protein